MSEKPLTPWVIAEVGGKIVGGHCDCMAGLGETCSHVASMLWAIESGIRLRDSMTVTQKKAYWVIPNSVKEVPYAPIMDINFFGKSHSINRVTPTSTPSSSRSSSHTPPTLSTASTPRSLQPPLDEELEDFYKALASNSTKPAILSIIEPYSSKYVPVSLNEDLPMCLLDLMKPENLTKEYGELFALSKQCSITVTPAHIKTVENKTRCQSKCNLWHRMRSGRITASNFRTICHTNQASPSTSLIMTICHPELKKFTSAATSWGSEHEKTARDIYLYL